MNQAQRQLPAAAASSSSVKEIAAQWGISEPGRFAVKYKRLFGESPSKTREHSAGPSPAPLAEGLPDSAGL